MAKKTKYVCSSCGAQAATWLGKCPVCNEWNTYLEEITEGGSKARKTSVSKTKPPILIDEIENKEEQRINCFNDEFNRVLGGGIIPGSLILLGGEPGIGKSTLALQIALNININVLYVSGEESPQQIKLRADRISTKDNKCYIFAETTLENILENVNELKPRIVVIDSIQTIHTEKLESTPGSVSQVRECTAIIQRYAKQTNISFIIIGHINKE
ncbi:MAG: AAA family ATPase, partial [Bacteroidota bacterium]|nr:AAA family ATPase [Bacteroidota bacterium]